MLLVVCPPVLLPSRTTPNFTNAMTDSYQGTLLDLLELMSSLLWDNLPWGQSSFGGLQYNPDWIEWRLVAEFIDPVTTSVHVWFVSFLHSFHTATPYLLNPTMSYRISWGHQPIAYAGNKEKITRRVPLRQPGKGRTSGLPRILARRLAESIANIIENPCVSFVTVKSLELCVSCSLDRKLKISFLIKGLKNIRSWKVIVICVNSSIYANIDNHSFTQSLRSSLLFLATCRVKITARKPAIWTK